MRLGMVMTMVILMVMENNYADDGNEASDNDNDDDDGGKNNDDYNGKIRITMIIIGMTIISTYFCEHLYFNNKDNVVFELIKSALIFISPIVVSKMSTSSVHDTTIPIIIIYKRIHHFYHLYHQYYHHHKLYHTLHHATTDTQAIRL